MEDLLEIIEKRTELEPDDCWTWQGAKSHNGYGTLVVRNSGQTTGLRAHRLSWELLVGPIPSGMVIDHLCRNRVCVNPDHLEPVTPAENARRGIKASQTHCKHGHEFTPENTRVRPNGTRRCRRCHRESSLERYYASKDN